MKVLAISGSPRKQSNSAVLLEYALKPFVSHHWQIQTFHLSDLQIQPCLACDECQKTGLCILQDDMQAIYEAYQECDALLLASPVYFRNVSAQLKSVFDRTYAVQTERTLEGKVGGAIAVGRGTGGGQALTVMIMYNWMLSCGVICVPGELNGVTAVASKPGEIITQERRLKQAEILGTKVLRVAEQVRGK